MVGRDKGKAYVTKEWESGPLRKLEKTKGAKCRKPIRLSQRGSAGDLDKHKFSWMLLIQRRFYNLHGCAFNVSFFLCFWKAEGGKHNGFSFQYENLVLINIWSPISEISAGGSKVKPWTQRGLWTNLKPCPDLQPGAEIAQNWQRHSQINLKGTGVWQPASLEDSSSVS